jgi:anti-anti-sigma regulatory factor
MDDRDWTPFVAQLRAHAEDGQAVHVLLDLQWVKHISIRFVTELEEFIRELVVRGSTLRLCGVRDQLRDIFKLVCLEHLDLGKSVPDALPRYVALLGNSTRDREECFSELKRKGRHAALRLSRPPSGKKGPGQGELDTLLI